METMIVLFVIFLILLSVLTTVYIVKYMKHSESWKCTENGCESDLNGKYSTKESCQDSCGVEATTEVIIKPQKYACTDDNRCVETDEGNYDTISDCSANCPKPMQYQPTYYYPQSLITPSYYYPRRMWWGPRWRGRHHRPRRRHRPRPLRSSP